MFLGKVAEVKHTYLFLGVIKRIRSIYGSKPKSKSLSPSSITTKLIFDKSVRDPLDVLNKSIILPGVHIIICTPFFNSEN